MVKNIEALIKLCAKVTDRHFVKIDAASPEVEGLKNVLSDEMVEVANLMGVRKPTTPEALSKVKGCTLDPQEIGRRLEEMSQLGLVEYNWENEDRHKQYILPPFVPGCAEFLNMNPDTVNAYPEVCTLFERMTRMPLEKITPMVPMGGAGIGMHVIPVEKAIETEQKSVSIEHISYWLDKYDGKYAVGACSCRRSRRVRGEGCGHLEDDMCVGVGDMADYCVETNKGRYVTREEVMEILRRAEDNGFVHEITNIDGEGKIFAICNCCVCSCYALRTSQLFNTPNMSRSAYVAEVDREKCVACGQCVEYCPAGAVKLGQKLCAKDGPVVYPKQVLPDETPWGEDKWNPDYRDSNRKNCYDTGTAPCKTACPAHIAVQGYINMAANGRYLDALKLIKKSNPFPAVCGHICNRKCEDACTRGSVDQAVAIDEIKKFIAEQELRSERRYVPQILTGDGKMHTEKMAVVGAGPSGLSCAYYLATQGYPVTVFEKEKTLGGMLTMGIPAFRLPRDVINAEIDILRELGVEFRTGVEVGRGSVTLQSLREEGYKAFYLAIGAQKSAPVGVPGEDLRGVYGGVDFLRRVNTGVKPRIGKKCAVIGGGNVAMDVCRTAVRLGAETYIVYRRSREELPADPAEVAEAMEEGVKFCFLSAPAAILGSEGRVSGLKVELMELGEPDEKGRRKPVGTGKYKTLTVDSVIGAIGQTIDWGKLDTGDMQKNEKGAALADALTLQTAQSDVFVGGDALTGPKFAIDAIAAGQEAAISMHRFVHPGQSLTIGRNRRDFIELDKANVAVPISSFDCGRRSVPAKKSAGEAVKTFADPRSAFTEEQVKNEAARCLGCGASVVDENKCIGCGVCTTKCEFDAIHLNRAHPEASTMVRTEDKLKAVLPYMLKRAVKIKRRQMFGKV